MKEYNFPSRLEDLLQKNQEFHVENAWDPAELSDFETRDKIQSIELFAQGGFEGEEQQMIFDDMYSMIVGFENLESDTKEYFLKTVMDSETRATQLSLDGLSTVAKTNMKVYIYFFLQLLKVVESYVEKTPQAAVATKSDDKGKAKKGMKAKSGSNNDFDWSSWRPSILKLCLELLEIDNSKLYSMGIVPEVLLNCYWEYALMLLEKRPSGTGGHNASEIGIRNICIDIICLSTKLFCGNDSSGSYISLATALINSLTTAEYMAQYVAEVCRRSNQLLVKEILVEIGKPHIAKMPSVKNVGTFIEVLTKLNPELIISNLPVINGQVDSPAHQIRSSVIAALGSIVAHIHVVCSDPSKLEQTDITANAEGEEEEDDEDDDIDEDSILADQEKADEAKKQRKLEKKKLKQKKNSQDANGDNDDDDDEGNKDSDDEGDEKPEIPEINVKNMGQLSRVRDSIMNVLIERTHDKSYFTRAAILKTWASLLEANSVPVSHFSTICDIALDRLVDKTAMVRKNAIGLLTAILDNNPFGGMLDIDHHAKSRASLEGALINRVQFLRASNQVTTDTHELLTRAGKGRGGKGKKVAAKLGVILEEDEEEDDEDGDDNESVEDEDAKRLREQIELEEYNQFLQSEDVKGDADVIDLRAKLEYTEDTLRLIESMTRALQSIEDMLFSKSSTDVTESLQFVARAVNFSIKGSAQCLQKAFSLVWHQELTIKNECLNAFSNVYLTDGAINGEAQALSAEEMTSNLIQLTGRCEESEVTSLEQIVAELFQSDRFRSWRDEILECLWNRIAKESTARVTEYQRITQTPGAPKNDFSATNTLLGAAIRTVGMIAKFSLNSLSADKVNLLTQTASHEHVFKELDFFTLRSTCICLQATAPYVYFPNKKDAHLAYNEKNHPALQKALLGTAPFLRDILLGSYCRDDETISSRWFGICEEAVHALFHVHPCPDEVIGSLVATLYLELSELQSPRQIAHLSRLIFFLGQASLGTLVYTERIAGIAKKSKEAATLKAKDTAASAVTASAPTVARTGTAGKTRLSTSSEKGGHEEEDAMEMEMGLAASADAIHEMTCNNVIETQLVLNNILGKFHPLIAYVVANENGTFSNPLLRETALLALCRFMSVSVALCERYLPVLFTALEKETQPHVRTSIMIGLGDLAFRFPNALEPWTAHLYSRLSDDSVMVRYNTLTVLTHLILNDMVKVKGQVSHVVACLTDEHDRIRDLAATFFTKLSERSNNPVYNLLGDIIATLSNDKPSVNASGHKDTNADVDNDEDITTNIPAVESDTPVLVAALDQSSLPAKYLTKAEFQKTMQFMLGFVKKDIQANSLLERLLVRLSMAQSVQQRRKLAFCIGQLKINEKGVKRIVDLFKQIKDALYDEEVREHIVNAVKTAKRGGRGFGASSSGATSAAATGKAEGAVEEEQAEAALLEQTSAPSTANTAEAKNIIAEFDALIENIKACLDGNYPAEGDTAAQDGESDVKVETADGDDAPVVPATDNSVQPMTRNGKKAPVKKGKSAPKKKKARMSYSDEEGDDDGEDAENDADDDDDEQDEEADTENTVNRGKPSNRGASKVSTAKAKKNEPAPAKSGRTGRLKKTSQIALGDDSD